MGSKRKIVGNHGDNNISTGLKFDDIQNAIFGFVGLFMVATSIPLMGKNIILYLVNDIRPTHNSLLPELAHLGLQLLIGISLFLGPSNIKQAIRKMCGK
jgi:hypothetical protein